MEDSWSGITVLPLSFERAPHQRASLVRDETQYRERRTRESVNFRSIIIKVQTLGFQPRPLNGVYYVG